jgi:hypothetical protein
MTQKPKGPDPEMNNSVAAGASKIRPGGLDRQIQAKIGQQLRAMYDEVVDQGVPDRFADLLQKLDAAGAKKDDQGTKKDDQEPRS